MVDMWQPQQGCNKKKDRNLPTSELSFYKKVKSQSGFEKDQIELDLLKNGCENYLDFVTNFEVIMSNNQYYTVLRP